MSHAHKLTDAQRSELADVYVLGERTFREVGEMFGVSGVTAYRAVKKFYPNLKVRRANYRKLSAEARQSIIDKAAAGETQASLAREFGVSRPRLNHLVSKKGLISSQVVTCRFAHPFRMPNLAPGITLARVTAGK
jgi:transposase